MTLAVFYLKVKLQIAKARQIWYNKASNHSKKESTMKRLALSALILATLSLTACQSKTPQLDKDSLSEQSKQQTPKLTLSNLSDTASLDEVTNILKTYLDEQSVNDFIKGVTDYNDTIQHIGLTKGFEEKAQPEYDVDKLNQLWTAQKGDFIGTNCRLSTFNLLKNNISIPKGTSDDDLLFLDNNAITLGQVLNEEESQRFRVLFSKVKTSNTKDIRLHAQKMAEHFSTITFDDKAQMISVVLHDNLDGDFLFVGHVGVLVPDQYGYLFVEKLAFDEPFQAVRFKTKDDCFNYLYTKYQHYHDDTTAKPFIMANNQLVELEAYQYKK